MKSNKKEKGKCPEGRGNTPKTTKNKRMKGNPKQEKIKKNRPSLNYSIFHPFFSFSSSNLSPNTR